MQERAAGGPNWCHHDHTLRADHVGSYGYPRLTTPHIGHCGSRRAFLALLLGAP
jgi:hypothetical protein